MSGVMRNVLADIAEEGLTGETAIAEISPEKLRAEKGTQEEDNREEVGEKDN